MSSSQFVMFLVSLLMLALNYLEFIKCDVHCPPGFYFNNSHSSCNICPIGTYQPLTDQTSCLPCDPGTFSSSTGLTSRCSEVCPQGYYCPGGPGIACPAGTYQMYVGQQNLSSCISCPSGTFQALGGSSSCTECLPGTYQALTNRPTVCNQCPGGTYQEFSGQSTCRLCELGYYSPLQATYCSACSAGMYCSQLVSLIPIPTQLLTHVVHSVLSPLTGTMQMVGGGTGSPCPQGTYQSNNTQSTCESCITGSYSTSSIANQCTLCIPGYYCVKPIAPPFSTAAAIIHCDPNTYQPYYNQTSVTSCLQCPSGSYSCSDETAECDSVISSPGFYDIVCQGIQPCEPGSYQPFYNQTTCISCGAGTYLPVSGATNITQCLLCPAGSYCPTKSPAPTPCRPGTYQPNEGQATCIPCALGYYVSSYGSTSQSICPAGFYCAQSTLFPTFSSTLLPPFSLLTGGVTVCSTLSGGATSPTACPIGTAQPNSGSSSCETCAAGSFFNTSTAVQCVTCLAGSFCYTIADSCGLWPGIASCPPDTYQSLTGQSTCTFCSLGSFSNAIGSTQCQACPIGSYCARQTSTYLALPSFFLTGGDSVDPTSIRFYGSAQLCPAGSAQPSSGSSTCQLCSSGYYYNKTTATECYPCPQGYYCNTPDPLPLFDGDAILPCPGGTYQPLTGQMTCLMCPIGSYSAQAATSCQICQAGYYCIQPAADILVIPSLLTGGTLINSVLYGGSSSPIACPPGTYQPNANQSTCQLCEIGTYSSISASTSPCSLYCDPGFYCAQAAADLFILPFLLQGGVILNSTLYGGASAPQECPFGTYQNQNHQSTCQLCDLGTYTVSSQSTECSGVCQAGFYCAQTLSSITVPSALLVGGTNISSSSSPGSWALFGGGSPTPCPPGTYQNANKQWTCNLVDLGMYTSAPASTQQGTLCPAGTFCAQPASNISISSLLLSGSVFLNSSSSSSILYGGGALPVSCPSGTFQPLNGSSTCLLCDVGSTSSVGSTTCSLCKPGSYCSKSSVLLVNALPPSANVGDISVVRFGLDESCPLGTFQPRSGASTCQLCEVGSTTPSTGATQCNLCPTGSYCAQSAAPLLMSLPSLFGGYTDHGVTLYGGAPTPCPQQTFQPNVGQSACNQCASNSGINQTTCAISGPPCAGGEYAVNNVCHACQPGTFSLANSSSCTPCADGFYQPAAGQASCLPCPYMMQSTQAFPSNATNVTRPAGNIMCSFDAVAADSPYFCPPGFGSSYAGSSFSYSTCTACPVGTFSTGTFVSSQPIAPCLVCAPGTYQPLTGQSSCVSCPSGTVSNYPFINQNTYPPLPNCNLCQVDYYQPLMGQSTCSECNLAITNGAFECVAQANSFHALGFGDPHFVGFDGSDFDFMGEAGSVYNLYTSHDLLVNAHLSLAKDPSHYPQYESPMWMDSIAVVFANHSFIFDVYDVPLHRPTVDGLRMPTMMIGSTRLHRRRPSVNNYDDDVDDDASDRGFTETARLLAQSNISFTMSHDTGLILSLSLGSEYRVNVSLHNDNWSELYMDVNIEILFTSASSALDYKPSDGVVGQTRQRPQSFHNGVLMIDGYVDNYENSFASASAGASSMFELSSSSSTTSSRNNVNASNSQFWIDRLARHSDKFKITDANLLSTNFEANLYRGTVVNQKNSTRTSALLLLNDTSRILFDFHGANVVHTFFRSRNSLLQVDARLMRFNHRHRHHEQQADETEQDIYGIKSVNVRFQCANAMSPASTHEMSLKFGVLEKFLDFGGFNISIPALQSRHVQWSAIVQGLSSLLLVNDSSSSSFSWRVDYFQEHAYTGSEMLAVRRIQVNNVELRLHLHSVTLCIRVPGARSRNDFTDDDHANSKAKAPIHEDDDDGRVADHGYLFTGPVYHRLINGDYDADCLVVLRLNQKFDSVNHYIETMIDDRQ